MLFFWIRVCRWGKGLFLVEMFEGVGKEGGWYIENVVGDGDEDGKGGIVDGDVGGGEGIEG